MTRRTIFTSLACYLAVVALLFAFAVLRVRTQNRFAAQTAPDVLPEDSSQIKTPPDEHAKPFFSLQTNRTYATGDRTRLWVNYRGVDSLDFRVYRVKDPLKFFRQLENPHQVGEDEQAEVGEAVKRKPTFLEKLRAFKSYVYGGIKGYVRGQLQNSSRKSFNQKFRADDEDDTSNRTPLNVADYARVPLLNPDQMVSSWREKLPPLEDVYDRRMISLGRREPGVYLVEAVNGDLRAFGIAIVTDIALVQKSSSDGQMLVYAVDRKTGAPREGTRVQIVKGKEDVKDGVTDAQGLLRFQFEKKKAAAANADEEEPTDAEGEEAGGDAAAGGDEAAAEPTDNSYLITATAGESFAISDLDSYYFAGSGEDEEGSASGGTLTSYIYTDRPVYRPEQKVYFKGILRQLTEAGYKLTAEQTVTVSIQDQTGGRIYEQAMALSSRGTFSGELDLPEETPLGTYNINAQIGDASATGYFEVQEYKKPEFKVSATTSQKFVNVGERAKFTVSARYYFGAPVTRADVKYYIHRARSYAWFGGDDEGGEAEDEIGADPSAEEGGGGEYYGGYGDSMVKEGEGKLDAQGRLDIEFTVPEPGEKENWDYTYTIEAQVTDASRRTMEGGTSFTGVRGNIVAYASPERYVYYQGDTAKILVTSNDREGRPVSTNVRLTFFERRWEKVMKRTEYGDEYADYESRERELSSAVVQTDAAGKAAVDYAVPISGSVHIRTTVEENGRRIVSEAGSIWVADRENRWTDLSYQEEGQIKLVPDKKSYRAGEVAHVLALLPTDKAHLLVTTELMTVMSARRVDSTGRAVVIDVPIEAKHAPNIFLNVTYVRNSDMYSQDVMLVVPARDRLLNLQIIPNKKEFRPRETASYTVLARNGEGSPVAGAEVSLGVVDESIYQIAPESVGDIRREFYGRRYNQVQTSFSVNYNFTGYAGKKIVNLAANKKNYQLADFKNDGDTVNPAIRKLFKDTAFWQPSVVTGADGKATVKFELPDNLTTWRATARAVTADTRVGTAVEKVVERKDVIIRMAMPRFLTQGDSVTLSGIVHNYLKADAPTKITIDVGGANLLDAAEQVVTIPKGGEFRVNWRVQAPATGELKVLAKALTNAESDAVELSIPIVPRGLKQTRAESVALADEEVERTFTYQTPANADANSRSLRIEVAPSIAGTLFGALDYLTGYPYGCTEQTMSQFLPTVIVKQTLQNVETASIKDTNDIDRKARRGIKRLYNYQHEDGGWGWWKDDPTDPWMTAYVVDGFVLARRAGYEVDEERLGRGREKLKAMIDAGRADDGQETDAETRAYMIYALNESGAADARYLNALFDGRGKLQPYGRALLALALKDKGDVKRAAVVAGEIERTATAGGADAHWSSMRKGLHGAGDEANDVEATALSVKALARISPQSELLAKAARWLVASRKHGYYWLSTKDTAFAIYGLTDYLKVSRELQPDYALEVYLNGEQVLARQMTAADATSAQTFVINRKGGAVGGTNELRIVKRGSGVLYLSTTLVHYTSEEQVAAQGSPQLKLTREYQRLRVVENGDGSLAWKVEPLGGELRSGDIIVSRLRVEGKPANFLLIEDPIPSGCEQVEQVSGIDLNYNEKDWSDWYSAREFRDQRAVFFVSSFDGSATYQYAMRVQVPGEFRVAPARVELMYQPDVQSNSAGTSLKILDRQ
ncbi:MAG TPA: MG2 domain-containing protein [Pyrinomonadaceae bacterium]|nr:MG2 domain-containing protein [Pyrinomonadaceae bacterium]